MRNSNSKFMFFMLTAFGRGLKGVYKFDNDMRAFGAELPNGYTVRIGVSGNSARIVFALIDNKLIVYKSSNAPLAVDLDIIFKSKEVFMPMLKGKKSIKQSYAEHDFMLAGDIFYAMTVVDMINLTSCYLFPSCLLKKTSCSLPKRETAKARLYAYILLGI